MGTKTFEFETAKVIVHYKKLPTKEDLEPVCAEFMKAVMRAKGEVDENGQNKRHSSARQQEGLQTNPRLR